MSNDLSGAVYGNVVQAQSVGQVHFHQDGGDRDVVPQQLPGRLRVFAGRVQELDALRRWQCQQGDQALLVVLTGQPGVGKTALGLRWLQEVRSEYPDGCLFVDLGGTVVRTPTTPGEVLEWFLLSLGVDAKRVPVDVGQREVLFRTLTTSRKLLVVLDNALSAAQVQPLIPSGTTSLVLVTSRFRLSRLAMDGARWLEVPPLGRSDSVRLLRGMLGAARVTAEGVAAGELADLCGGLPLALSVVGARLSTRPRRTLTREVAVLRVTQQRLAALAVDDMSVEAVLDTSYHSVGEDAQILYRACASSPGRDFGIEVAASAVEWDVARTERAAETLLAAHLFTEVDGDRFQFHDLIRLHAQQRAAHDSTRNRPTEALRRMTEWYLGRTVAADHAIHPLRQHLGPRYGTLTPDDHFADPRAAFTWLERERLNIGLSVRAAIQNGWHELAWQFCESLWGFFLHTRHYGHWLQLHQVGIASAIQCGDRPAEARLRAQLAFAYAKLHRYADAVTETRRTLEIATEDGDDQGRASALSALGRAARGLNDLPAALAYYQESRDIQQRLRRWRGVALNRRRVGDLLSRLGRHDEAVMELQGAADTMDELGDSTQYARALTFLGAAHIRAGHPVLAIEPLSTALDLMRDIGSPYYQAEILAQMGAAAEQSGDRAGARSHYVEAYRLYSAVQDPEADVVQSRLAAL